MIDDLTDRRFRSIRALIERKLKRIEDCRAETARLEAELSEAQILLDAVQPDLAAPDPSPRVSGAQEEP